MPYCRPWHSIGIYSISVRWVALAACVLGQLVAQSEFNAALSHGIGGQDASFVAGTKGPDILPFVYLGAKHMVTGYDHLLFIFGVIFFLYRMRDVVIYVTLFSIGHSITLLAGSCSRSGQFYLVDAASVFRWSTRRSTISAASSRSSGCSPTIE